MRKKFVLATSVAVLVLGLLSVSLFKSATPVSAQEVLRRSYAAQQAAEANPGIQHTRTEMYSNPRVIPGPKGMYGRETRSIVESFFDLQSGKNRVVIRDAETGQVTEVWGFDGNYVYSSKVPAPHQVDDTLRVYRAPQPAGTKNLWALKANGGLVNEKDVFEAAVKDPTAQILGQETWTDGRTVHVLRLQQLGKAVLADSQAHNEAPPMITTMYFDSQTFQLVEQQMTIQREGKEILFYSSRQLVQETLPVTTGVAWDFRDLANVRVVDDPEGEHGDLLPAPISAEKLASRVKSAYRLRAVPEGFVMQMSAPPKSKADEPDVYAVEYRNDAGDYLHIQGGTLGADPPIQNADETYTTASGLVVSFVAGRERAVGDKRVTYAIVQAPDGTAFELTSSLPRERAKALAEELVPVR